MLSLKKLFSKYIYNKFKIFLVINNINIIIRRVLVNSDFEKFKEIKISSINLKVSLPSIIDKKIGIDPKVKNSKRLRKIEKKYMSVNLKKFFLSIKFV